MGIIEGSGCVNQRLDRSQRRVTDERLELRDGQDRRDELTGLCEIAVASNEPVRLGGEGTGEKFGAVGSGG